MSREMFVSYAGGASRKRPHEFRVVSDSKLGELFVVCVCDWQTAHYFEPGKAQEITSLLEKDILEHNASEGGAL